VVGAVIWWGGPKGPIWARQISWPAARRRWSSAIPTIPISAGGESSVAGGHRARAERASLRLARGAALPSAYGDRKVARSGRPGQWRLDLYAVDERLRRFAARRALPAGIPGLWQCVLPFGMKRIFADFTPVVTGKEMYAWTAVPFSPAMRQLSPDDAERLMAAEEKAEPPLMPEALLGTQPRTVVAGQATDRRAAHAGPYDFGSDDGVRRGRHRPHRISRALCRPRRADPRAGAKRTSG